MSISVAFRSFFAALFDREKSERIAVALSGEGIQPQIAKKPAENPVPTKPQPPVRSDALTLLSALQREARFVDFVKESLDGASDEQIGAVVRDVHRDCGAVLERLLAIRPLVEDEEGAAIEVPPGFDATRFRLTGNVEGQPPYRGKVAHHGWQATRCELPSWSGNRESALVVAPVDVEL
jgi:hypothetical protein